MRQPPTYTTWKITCRSAEEAQALQQWLSSRIDLDRVWTDTTRVAPNGKERVQTIPHRLGDYFAAIRLLPDSHANPASFQLVFQRRPDAGRFWKDLMVNLLQEIEETPQKLTIEPESKREKGPNAPAVSKGQVQMAEKSLETIRGTLNVLRDTFRGISSRHDRCFCQWIIAEDGYRDRLSGQGLFDWAQDNLIAQRGFTLREAG